jgi:DNA-binding NarL/FixJ family response regulator
MTSALVQLPETMHDAEPHPAPAVDATGNAFSNTAAFPTADSTAADKQVRVCIVAESQLLRETLFRMLSKGQDIDVTGMDPGQYFRSKSLAEGQIDVLLLVSRGNLEQDLALIRNVHLEAPAVRTLVIGTTKEKSEFLQFVRAGIDGYLWREASMEEVLAGIRGVQSGEAVCPGALCSVLFRYFQQESAPLPCASVKQRLGLTRREQQLIPLIAKGLTNKEIANHFCLSEQTVKNHLYRMKHKIGAEDRLSIVQRYRTQGFLL